jgi:HD-GYP domain-containing protein (c-di-GMP phosphodiesterase class II)
MADDSQKQARAAEPSAPDVGSDEEAVRAGRELVTQFSVLLKTAQIHDASNIAMVNPSETLAAILQQLFRWSKVVHLHLSGDYLFLDDLRLRMDIERFSSFNFVIQEMKRVRIGGVTFHEGLGPPELRRFASFVAQLDAKQSDDGEGLLEAIETADFAGIDIQPLEDNEEEYRSFKKNAKEQAKSSYFKTMTTVTEAMENIKLGRAVSVKRAKRSVQTMVDSLLTDESTILGLTTLRCHDVYTHNHSVNVCILSLAVGQRLGYSPQQLTLLGLAGLFHDMGKTNIPLDVLNKSTEFSQEDWQIMRQHPVEGVKLLLRLKGINEVTIRMVAGAFEHHLNYDLSGYPKVSSDWNVSLFGRIISVVDCYDALTSSRVYNRVPYSPEKALKFMLSKSGKAFDPLILKLFVNSIGIYPVGSMVLFNTGELGVVMASQADPENVDRPRIKLVSDVHGNEIDGDIIDLTDAKASGSRIITRTVDPTKFKVDVSKFFV